MGTKPNYITQTRSRSMIFDALKLQFFQFPSSCQFSLVFHTWKLHAILEIKYRLTMDET